MLATLKSVICVSEKKKVHLNVTNGTSSLKSVICVSQKKRYWYVLATNGTVNSFMNNTHNLLFLKNNKFNYKHRKPPNVLSTNMF